MRELTREPIPQEDYAAGASAHPYANKPLTAFQSITGACGDCGHTSVLDRDRLMAMTAVPTFAALWRHAYCSECRAIGSTKRNVTLHGLLIEPEAVPRTEWSRKKVFSEDRTDPFPGLRRRSLIAAS